MNVNRNLVRNWQDDAALERFQMIAPLLDADLDPAKRIQLRRQTAEISSCAGRLQNRTACLTKRSRGMKKPSEKEALKA